MREAVREVALQKRRSSGRAGESGEKERVLNECGRGFAKGPGF